MSNSQQQKHISRIKMFEEKSKYDETKPIERDNLLDNVHYATVLAFCDKFSKHLPEVRKLNIHSIEEILTRQDLTGFSLFWKEFYANKRKIMLFFIVFFR